MGVSGVDLAVSVHPVQPGRQGIILQTYGLPFSLSLEAADEAAALFASSLRGKRPFDGSGDASPSASSGRLTVLSGRLVASYRLINEVLVLVLTPPNANPFLPQTIANAVGKLLVGLCGSVKVTEAKLRPRFPELSATLDELLGLGLSRLPPAFAHTARADHGLDWTSIRGGGAASAARSFGRAIRRRVKVASGAPAPIAGASSGVSKASIKKAGSAARAAADAGIGDASARADAGGDDAASVTHSEGPGGAARSGVSGAVTGASALGSVAFTLPEGSLPPPPAGRRGRSRAGGPFAAAAAPGDDEPDPYRQAEMEAAAAWNAREEARREAEEAKRRALEEEAAVAAEPQPGGSAEAEEPADGGAWATFGAEEAAPEGDAAVVARPAPPPPPVPTLDDLRASLRLVESWHASVGPQGLVVEAGTRGFVERHRAPFGLDSARFRLGAAIGPGADRGTAARADGAAADRGGKEGGAERPSGKDAGSGGPPGTGGVGAEAPATPPPVSRGARAALSVASLHGTYALRDVVTAYGEPDTGGRTDSGGEAGASAGTPSPSTSDPGAVPTFLARLVDAPGNARYLAYSLPSAAAPPPVRVHLSFARATRPGPGGHPQALLILRVRASSAFPLFDIVADTFLPPGLAPQRTSRPAIWARDTSALRFAIPRLAPGETVVLRAVLSGSGATLDGLRSDSRSRVVFTGPPGRSLSGLSLELGFAKGADGELPARFVPGHAWFFGDIEVAAAAE